MTTSTAWHQFLTQGAKKGWRQVPGRILKTIKSSSWLENQGAVAGSRARTDTMSSTPERTSTPSNEKPEKSYLTAAVGSLNPWGSSRTATPDPFTSGNAKEEGSGLKNQHGKDFRTPKRHGIGSRRYPPDCPPLNARWFYAVDVPKRKPKLLKTNEEDKDTKPAPPAKKLVTFSEHDSRAIESAYQSLADEYDDPSLDNQSKEEDGVPSVSSAGKRPNTSMNEAGKDEHAGGKVRVPVHEDFLFDVDIEERELCPVYWLGPIYEVRRGSWFFQEGSTLRPCEENLATQLEEGYLKIKPFRYPKAAETSSRPNSMVAGDLPTGGGALAMSGAFSRGRPRSADVTPKASVENLRAANQQSASDETSKDEVPPSPHQPQAYRLFGTYMNSLVTYQDSSVAWLAADSIMSRVSSTVYQKFAGGSYLGGVKLVRGYPESVSQAKDSAGDKTPLTATGSMKRPNSPAVQLDERQQKLLKRRSAPPGTSRSERSTSTSKQSAMELEESPDAAAALKRDEKSIQNDYNDKDGESQGRKVDHLILVTHGIGQRLGMRTESVNFIHDVNALRKTLKNVYGQSADLQALNSEIDKLPKNCRVQVLPVCWRHLLEFPKKSVPKNRREHDIGDAFGDEEESYPSLEDITVEGVPFVRSLITDLALDILLYQSAYRERISTIVLEEANRIYNLFCERNPDFNGKISLIGHSLGSAILFDILCRQKADPKPPTSKYSGHRQSSLRNHRVKSFEFDFDVEDFYCLGSPIGLFQMLKGRNILARSHRKDELPAESPLDPDYLQDPFFTPTATSYAPGEPVSSETGLPLTISSPKTAQLYNIFHPSDPIAYRLEPLISTAMSTLKPQALPYTKKTISASVSGIGATIGQSVSGLWSSLSSGIASSLLNRSLGLTNDDVARMGESSTTTPNRQASLSVGAGTNVSGGVIPSDTTSLQWQLANENKTKVGEKIAAADRDGTKSGAMTLIGPEMETLYAGFQNHRKSIQVDDGDAESYEKSKETDEKAKKFKKEEAKVRALNGNGRVDYAIQESVLDFNPINTIASHLSYWADEDVSHFIMSQLLSRHRITTRAHTKDDFTSKMVFDTKKR